GLGSTAAFADGVEFQPVPIDVSKRCSSLVLEGTSRFAGTAFVVPKVFLSINKSRDRLFEIIPLRSNDDYLLRIALFIPSDPTEALAARPNSGDFFPHGCDLNDLRTQRNRKQTEAAAQGGSAKPILRLTPLPIQQLSVRINGLDQAFVIG